LGSELRTSALRDLPASLGVNDTNSFIPSIVFR
jgi:hypothetical protein